MVVLRAVAAPTRDVSDAALRRDAPPSSAWRRRTGTWRAATTRRRSRHCGRSSTSSTPIATTPRPCEPVIVGRPARVEVGPLTDVELALADGTVLDLAPDNGCDRPAAGPAVRLPRPARLGRRRRGDVDDRRRAGDDVAVGCARRARRAVRADLCAVGAVVAVAVLRPPGDARCQAPTPRHRRRLDAAAVCRLPRRARSTPARTRRSAACTGTRCTSMTLPCPLLRPRPSGTSSTGRSSPAGAAGSSSPRPAISIRTSKPASTASSPRVRTSSTSPGSGPGHPNLPTPATPPR